MSKNPTSNRSQHAKGPSVLKGVAKIKSIKNKRSVFIGDNYQIDAKNILDNIIKTKKVIPENSLYSEESGKQNSIPNPIHQTYTVIPPPETNHLGRPLGSRAKQGDATLEQSLGPFVEKYGAAKIAEFIIGRASPDDRALIAGMATRDLMKVAGTETTTQKKSSRQTKKKKPYSLFTDLSPKQVADVIQNGKKRPWNERCKFGYPWKKDVFEFVCDEYKFWIVGLTQELLKLADENLYDHFMQAIAAKGLPVWLDVPSEADAELRKITDPIERAKREANREFEDDRKRNAPVVVDTKMLGVSDAVSSIPEQPVLDVIKEAGSEIATPSDGVKTAEMIADEIKAQVTAKWLKDGKGKMNVVAFIRDNYLPWLSEPFFTRSHLMHDDGLASDYSWWVRPDRHPEDSLWPDIENERRQQRARLKAMSAEERIAHKKDQTIQRWTKYWDNHAPKPNVN